MTAGVPTDLWLFQQQSGQFLDRRLEVAGLALDSLPVQHAEGDEIAATATGETLKKSIKSKRSDRPITQQSNYWVISIQSFTNIPSAL